MHLLRILSLAAELSAAAEELPDKDNRVVLLSFYLCLILDKTQKKIIIFMLIMSRFQWC